jgi:hypothetical protein
LDKEQIMQEADSNSEVRNEVMTKATLQSLYEQSLGETSPERAAAREQLLGYVVSSIHRTISLGKALDWVKTHLPQMSEAEVETPPQEQHPGS